MHHRIRPRCLRARHATGPPQPLTTPCTADRSIDPDEPPLEAGTDIFDEYPELLGREIDCVEAILHATAGLIETTTRPDHEIGIAQTITRLARLTWRRHDHNPPLTDVVADVLADHARWLVAYACGRPGADRHERTIATALAWLDASPRPLRALIVRCAVTRYLH